MPLEISKEFEIMHNVALGAEAIFAFATEFAEQSAGAKQDLTLWHVATVLPLCLHERSRRAILKRRHSSGLRSILSRDPDNDIAQNEPIFNLNKRVEDLLPRTFRSLNCAFGWGFLTLENGLVLPRTNLHRSIVQGEAGDVVRAARKLGAWAGENSSFEYFTILGLGFNL